MSGTRIQATAPNHYSELSQGSPGSQPSASGWDPMAGGRGSRGVGRTLAEKKHEQVKIETIVRVKHSYQESPGERFLLSLLSPALGSKPPPVLSATHPLLFQVSLWPEIFWVRREAQGFLFMLYSWSQYSDAKDGLYIPCRSLHIKIIPEETDSMPCFAPLLLYRYYTSI